MAQLKYISVDRNPPKVLYGIAPVKPQQIVFRDDETFISVEWHNVTMVGIDFLLYYTVYTSWILSLQQQQHW